MAEPCKNYTFKLDNLTNTKIEWLLAFSKGIGVPNPTKRQVITRAIEVYLECMEDTLAMYNVKPRHSEVISERSALLRAITTKQSAFNSHKLPVIDVKQVTVFPSYSSMSKPKVALDLPQYVRGGFIKPKTKRH